ncbi:MAG: NADH-quinone oxidoreductase subunit L [Micrococcales bacterium]|nr:MAG: NADH-quinone oxidoreductase subunit L [Micrococcales bacterium]PIE25837.1 MAG: NADH-quinone oxidoreductase subunit L [Micrococcales bacterium]
MALDAVVAGTALAEANASVPASGAASLAWLLVALPLASAALLLLAGRACDSVGHWVGTAVSWSTFVVAALILFSLLGTDAHERVQGLHLYQWLHAGAFTADVGLRVDPLSVSFALLVSFVGSLIHVYSVGYMEHDPDRRRFFAYLNLFIASMMLLVLADNFLLLYVGWEGVGLASYLLIGFWNQVPEYATAAKKAFVVNRVGDMGLGLAIGAMFLVVGAVGVDEVLGAAGTMSEGWATFIGLMLLLAACGKSAQFPLHSWLGDAMAGPTPVSALIHAATMVTAGVYLVVRSGPIFEMAPTASLAVVVVGAITLTYGAIVGTAKDDIKKALAASTMSQIGYMMLAAGLGPIGYAYAIFHLITHGFFKAGMFLGAGSVMHGMNDSTDMRRYGNLYRHMRTTWWTFGAGYLAIIGFPFLSGYFSKDLIIEAAFVGEGWRPWFFGLVTVLVAGLTAYYMSRLFFMTFHGEERFAEDHHPHESPALMTAPMIVLAVGSVALGGLLSWLGFTGWLEPVTGHAEHHDPVLPIPVIIGLTLSLVALGTFIAYRQYWAATVARYVPQGSMLEQAARADLYQEVVNRALFEEPGRAVATTLSAVDRAGIDGGFTGGGRLLAAFGETIRKLQNGFVRSYAATMLLGVVALVGTILVVN